MVKNKALFTGAIINFIIGIGHLACLACLNRVFEIYDITDIMNRFAETYGGDFPYILTVIIALCFFSCGIYGLSACGIIRRLPLLKLGILAISSVFLIRALWGISIMINGFTCLELSSTLVAALVGLLYLLGGIKTFSKSNNNRK
jgi:hypothetical protein